MVLGSLLVWELPFAPKKKKKKYSKLGVAHLRQNKKGSFLTTALLNQIYMHEYFWQTNNQILIIIHIFCTLFHQIVTFTLKQILTCKNKCNYNN